MMMKIGTKRIKMECKMKQEKSWKQKIKEYWKEIYNSHREKLSEGAAHITKIMTWAQGNQWRRPKNKK